MFELNEITVVDLGQGKPSIYYCINDIRTGSERILADIEILNYK